MIWFIVGLFVGGFIGLLIGGLAAAAHAREEAIERERMMRAAWRDAMNERYVGPT